MPRKNKIVYFPHSLTKPMRKLIGLIEYSLKHGIYNGIKSIVTIQDFFFPSIYDVGCFNIYFVKHSTFSL